MKTASFFLVFISLAGCAQQLGVRASTVEIVDTKYRTGGASQAILGSYGHIAGSGFNLHKNVFSRDGLPRDQDGLKPLTRALLDADATEKTTAGFDADVTTTSAIKVGGSVDHGTTRSSKLHLLIIELDKGQLVERINKSPDFKSLLLENKDERIVTAVGVLVDMSEETYDTTTDAKIKISNISNVGDFSFDLSDSSNSTVHVAPGNIYCYEVAKPKFNKEQTVVTRLDVIPSGL